MAHLMNNNSSKKQTRSQKPNAKKVQNKRQKKKTPHKKQTKQSRQQKPIRKNIYKQHGDGIVTYTKTDKIFGVVAGVFTVILLIAFIGINSWRSSVQQKIALSPVGQTYYQYLTQQKNDNKKEAENTNVKDIAERLIKEEVGLSGNNKTYAKTGVYNKGVFINSAIITGDAVPKTTNFDGTATDYHTILQDSDYFKNVRQSQYNEMKQKAEENVSDNDKAKQDLSDMQNQINQARQDAGALKDNQHKNLANKKINNTKEGNNE